MKVEYLALIVAIISVLISLFGLIFTLRSFKKQLQLNFFADYTKRYQDIVLNFPEEINRDDFDIEKLDKKTRDKTLRYMRAYYDLCSEEFYLWKNNNIDDDTWREWEAGIKFAISKTAFKDAWNILAKDTIYYGDFYEFVDEQYSTIKPLLT